MRGANHDAAVERTVAQGMPSVRARVFHRMDCVPNPEQPHFDVPDPDTQSAMFGNLLESRDT